jgi:hypothetical protein
VGIDRRLERSEDQFVATQSAKERLAFQGGDERLLAGNDSGLWPTEKFVAAEADERGAFLQRPGRGGFALKERPFLYRK